LKNRGENSDRQPILFAETELQSTHGLFAFEKYWSAQGYGAIVGTDEAGRGPLAGPVVAAAVILPLGLDIPFLNDSKQVTARRRELLFDEILTKASACSWSRVEAAEIDKINIYQASQLAMLQALAGLTHPFDLVLSDAMPLPSLLVPCIPIIHGDARSASIAAASIVAKVVRDRIMSKLDEEFPEYGFKKHKGYGTAEHIKAIRVLGPCAIHRQTFAPIKSWRPLTDEN
jgi:ribonuclease HII